MFSWNVTLSTELECCLLNAQSWNMIKHALVTESTDRVMIDVKREYGTEIKESYCVEWDIWISFKLFLEFVTKRKFDSWDICISQSIVWNVIESTRDCLKVNNAEYFNSDTSRENKTPLFSLDIKTEWNWERLRKPTSYEFQAF